MFGNELSIEEIEEYIKTSKESIKWQRKTIENAKDEIRNLRYFIGSCKQALWQKKLKKKGEYELKAKAVTKTSDT